MPSVSVKRFSRGNFEKESPPPSPPQIEETQNEETENELYEEAYDEPNETDDDFLQDLTRSNYEKAVQDEITQKEQLKEQKIKDKETMKMIKQAEKKVSRKRPAVAAARRDDDTDSIFSDSPTPILGKDRRVLLKKINQYKSLFKNELKGYKVKKNPTQQDLENTLQEMEAIVDCNCVDEFLTDSILSCIQLVEGVSARTKNYNVSGLAEMLKANPRFHALCKQLMIKYSVFNQVPPEYQMVMLVATTAYICKTKNQHRDQINSFLDEPIPKK